MHAQPLRWHCMHAQPLRRLPQMQEQGLRVGACPRCSGELSQHACSSSVSISCRSMCQNQLSPAFMRHELQTAS